MAHRIQLTVSALLTTALVLGACGLDVVGVENAIGDAAVPDASVADVVLDAPSDAPPATTEAGVDASVCNATCEAATRSATGFSPVLYGEGTCPAGFDATEVVENPIANAGSCTCPTCQASAACAGTTVQTRSGNGAACTGGSVLNWAVDTGACVTESITYAFASNNSSIVLAAPTNVTCRAEAAVVPAQIAHTDKRLCTRRVDTCAGAMCALPASYAACLVAEGDVACPSGLTTKHVVGAGVDATCGACGCTPLATCTGTFFVYANTTCTGSPVTTVGTACAPVSGDGWRSHRLEQRPSVTCTVSPASAATVALSKTRTVCCPP